MLLGTWGGELDHRKMWAGGKDLGLLGKWVLIKDKGMCGVYDCEWREINEKKAKDRTLQRSFI